MFDRVENAREEALRKRQPFPGTELRQDGRRLIQRAAMSDGRP